MRRIALISVILLFAWSGLANAAACTQRLEKYGDQAVLSMTCTAVATAYDSTAVSATNMTALRGYYITEVITLPGGTGPTTGTAIVFNTADSPVLDLFGGIVTCHNTTATRFVPRLNTAQGAVGGASITNTPTLAASGNSVATGAFTIKIILWRN